MVVYCCFNSYVYQKHSFTVFNLEADSIHVKKVLIEAWLSDLKKDEDLPLLMIKLLLRLYRKLHNYFMDEAQKSSVPIS